MASLTFGCSPLCSNRFGKRRSSRKIEEAGHFEKMRIENERRIKRLSGEGLLSLDAPPKYCSREGEEGRGGPGGVQRYDSVRPSEDKGGRGGSGGRDSIRKGDGVSGWALALIKRLR